VTGSASTKLLDHVTLSDLRELAVGRYARAVACNERGGVRMLMGVVRLEAHSWLVSPPRGMGLDCSVWLRGEVCAQTPAFSRFFFEMCLCVCVCVNGTGGNSWGVWGGGRGPHRSGHPPAAWYTRTLLPPTHTYKHKCTHKDNVRHFWVVNSCSNFHFCVCVCVLCREKTIRSLGGVSAESQRPQ